MKWRFVYPWCRRVTPSSSILILRLLSTGVSVRFLPLPSNVPSYFLAASSLHLALLLLGRSSHVAPSLSQRVCPLSLRLPTFCPIPLPVFHPRRPTSPAVLSASRRNSLSRKKKGKRREKSMRDADWPLSAGLAPRVGSHRTQGRGLKMSSRCVIAYIDPTPLGVCTQQHPLTLTPTRGTHESRRSRDASTRSRSRRCSYVAMHVATHATCAFYVR